MSSFAEEQKSRLAGLPPAAQVVALPTHWLDALGKCCPEGKFMESSRFQGWVKRMMIGVPAVIILGFTVLPRIIG